MRQLVWIALGFAAGIVAGMLVLLGVSVWAIMIAFLLLSILYIFFRFRHPFVKVLPFVLVGIALGFVYYCGYDAVFFGTAREYDTQCLDLEITVSDYSNISSSGNAGDGTVLLDGKRTRVRFYIDEQEQLSPGDLVCGEFYLRYTGYDGHMSATYHQGKGIMLIAYAAEETNIVKSDGFSWKYFAAELRFQIRTLLDEIFPSDTIGFARALLLGDSSLLSKADDNALQNSGVRHIIAVSGLHVSILLSFVFLITGHKRWPAALVGIPVLCVFALITGATPSVLRACVMQCILLMSDIFETEYDSPSSLAAAVILILVQNPMALTSVSFQLSIGCVIGILVFHEKLYRKILKWKLFGNVSMKTFAGKLVRWFAGSVSVSVSAMVFTLPVSAYYFGSVCTVGVLTNLLTLWVISVVFIGIVVAVALAVIFEPLGILVAWVVAWPMRCVLWICRLISEFPFSAVSANNTYIVAWLVLAYVLFLVNCRLKNKRIILSVLCVMIGLCAALALSSLESHKNQYQMTVLDVGQGQCILLLSDDRTYVVDCGGDSGEMAADLAVQTLHTQGVFRIDGLILTHFDKDHAGGAISLLSQMPVERVYIPDADADNEIRLQLEELYSDRLQWVYDHTYLTYGHSSISIYPAEYGTNNNESSMCILFQAGNCDILITGDRGAEAEKELIQSVRLPQIEILVAGHHGSDHSTGMYLLKSLQPQVVVISVGKNNTYGHPNSETLHRLEVFGCRVWRTDINGTVVFRG